MESVKRSHSTVVPTTQLSNDNIARTRYQCATSAVLEIPHSLMQPEESCRPVMDPLYYDDHCYWQWYPYWNHQGYNADASTTRKDDHAADPLCVPSDSDDSDGEMSPNNQGKDTTTGPSESLAKACVL